MWWRRSAIVQAVQVQVLFKKNKLQEERTQVLQRRNKTINQSQFSSQSDNGRKSKPVSKTVEASTSSTQSERRIANIDERHEEEEGNFESTGIHLKHNT